MSRAGDLFQAFAFCRAIIEHPEYPMMPAKTQSALLTAVIRHADREGRFELKYETLGAELGRAGRNAGEAMRLAAPTFVEIRHRRRADGKQRPSAFRLSTGIRKRADEIVLRWRSGRTKPSSGVGDDEIVIPPGDDEIVTAGTVFERSLNGFGDDENVMPLEAVAAMLADEGLLPNGKDAHAA